MKPKLGLNDSGKREGWKLLGGMEEGQRFGKFNSNRTDGEIAMQACGFNYGIKSGS